MRFLSAAKRWLRGQPGPIEAALRAENERLWAENMRLRRAEADRKIAAGEHPVQRELKASATTEEELMRRLFDFDRYGPTQRKKPCEDPACQRTDVHPEHRRMK